MSYITDHHREMLDTLAGIKAKAAERDELMERLAYSIDHEIQRDIDVDGGITDDATKFYSTFNWDKYHALKRSYERAVKIEGAETFEFEGRVLYIGYAKRVLDYLKPHFERGRKG